MLPESPFCTAAQIAEQWKKNVAGLQEYQVIRDGSIFRAHLADSYLFHSEYQQALRLKEELIAQYEGKELEKVLQGEEVDDLLAEVPEWIDAEDYLLAIAQNW
jgi:hypothetical protein